MASPAILKIDIIADATKAISALKETGGAATTTGGAFSKAGKVIGGALAVGGVVSFGKASFAAAEESAQATARLEQVFASMGDTTGEAAKAAEDYASSLSSKIAVDDEAIMAAQAQLATFGAVSDETARAAGIFDRTTVAAADLAAAGFGTLDSNSVQLGKALQDPTKGLAALSKSGVTFTDSQKEQIKAMQESGDLLGAQKIVLKAVEDQVGGTAEATATGSDKMAIAFGEVQEQVGGKLMPVMTKLTDIFLKYQDIILPVGAALLGIAAAVKLYTLAEKAATVVKAIATAAQWAWNAATFAGVVPLLLVVAAIAALIAIGILIVKNWDTIKEAAAKVWSVMQDVWDKILGVVQGAFNWIQENWPLLLAILTGPFGLAVLAITKNWDKIVDAAKFVYDWIKENWPLLLAILTGPFGLAVLAIVKNWDKITTFFSELPGKIGGFLLGLFDKLIAPFSGVYEFVVDKFDKLVDYFAELPGNFVEGLKNLTGMFKNIFKAAFNGIANIWNDTVGKLSFRIPSWVPGIGGNGFDVPDIPTLLTGGSVLRTGLAVVHAGEMFSGVGRSFSSGGNVTINVTTTGLGADAPQIQRAVLHALQRHAIRNGPLDIPVRTAS